MTTNTDKAALIAAAIRYLDAEAEPSGSAIYRCDSTGLRYRASAVDLALLGRMLERGEPDAYSVWCSETLAEEMPRERCGCGEWAGDACSAMAEPAEMVLVEWMPDHLRETHRAAGNRGFYASNGAIRSAVTAACAADMERLDPEWVCILD
jgi:hypothetical protein